MTKTQNEEFVEFGVAQYFQVLKRRWLPAVFTVLLCTGVSAFIAAKSNRPVYESTGKLLFQSRDPQSELTGVGSDVSQFELDTVGRNDPLQNQANLLVSGLLLEEVIKTLDMRTPTGDVTPFDWVRKNLKVEQIPSTDILQVSYNSSDPSFSADFVNTLMRSYLRFNAKNQKSNVDAARNFIRGQLPQLRADFERASRNLRDFKAKNNFISLNSKSSEVSTLNADTLKNQRDTLLKLKSVNARSDALRQQLSQLSRNTNLDLVDISKLNDSSIIQQTLSDVQVVQANLEVQRDQYTDNHPSIVDLKLKLNSLNNVLQTQSSSILGKPSQIRAQDLQLSDLQKNLVSELSQVDIERQALQEEVQLLSTQKSSLGDTITNFANLEKIQQDLEHNLNNSRKRYFQLLESLEQLDLTEIKVRDSNQVQIIEAAVKSNIPVDGFKLKIVLAGAILGASLAFGLALLLDILDSRIKSVKHLEKLLEYPILGSIPKHELSTANEDILEFDNSTYLNKTNHVIALSGAFTPVYTAYQRAYVNLALLKNEAIPKILSVMSALPNEGKSEISANIAATIAQAGQQVLLVDANFRNPSQHKLWKLENNVGLSSVLHDSVNASLIRQKVAPNLYVISAGPAASQTSITSRYSQFLTFIAQVAQQYDCIIFDAGSILSEPDAVSLGKVCEGVLLVACLKYLQIQNVLNMKELLVKAEMPVLGVIVNQVEEEINTIGMALPHPPPDSPMSQINDLESEGELDVSNSGLIRKQSI